jgi:hypothetical protein
MNLNIFLDFNIFSPEIGRVNGCVTRQSCTANSKAASPGDNGTSAYTEPMSVVSNRVRPPPTWREPTRILEIVSLKFMAASVDSDKAGCPVDDDNDDNVDKEEDDEEEEDKEEEEEDKEVEGALGRQLLAITSSPYIEVYTA